MEGLGLMREGGCMVNVTFTKPCAGGRKRNVFKMQGWPRGKRREIVWKTRRSRPFLLRHKETDANRSKDKSAFLKKVGRKACRSPREKMRHRRKGSNIV